MTETTISHIKEFIGKEVKLKGWVYNIRSSGKIAFLILRDGTGFIQNVVVKNEVSEEDFNKVKLLSMEDTIAVDGIVQESPRAPGGVEILLKSIEMINHYKDEEYPIQKKEHGVDFLLNNRHLWLRSKKQFAIMRIRDEVVKAIRDYMYDNEYILFDSPIFTPTVTEGTTTLFETEYFGNKAYMSQSGQLYQEAGAIAFRKTYCFGPTFRAEKSKTKKHLTEFWMVEPEIAFADLNDVINISEDFVIYIVQRVLEKKSNELKMLGRNLSKLEMIKKPFYRITYDEALDIINGNGGKMEWGDDFGAEEDTILSKNFDKPVFIHHFPKKIKPFYMEIDQENPDLVLGVDMYAPEGYGELIGGSQRIYDYERLLKEAKKSNLNEDDYKWYIDLRRWGSCPHGGFGLGLERTIAWITGVEHIRTTIPFPRTINRIYP
jgi:asparaginyl-tRNA synthetase